MGGGREKRNKGNRNKRGQTITRQSAGRQRQAERSRINASIFNGVEHIALTPRVQTAFVYLARFLSRSLLLFSILSRLHKLKDPLEYSQANN